MAQREVANEYDRPALKQIFQRWQPHAGKWIGRTMPEWISYCGLFGVGIFYVGFHAKRVTLPRRVLERGGHRGRPNVQHRSGIVLVRPIYRGAVVEIAFSEINHLWIGGIAEALPGEHSAIWGAWKR